MYLPSQSFVHGIMAGRYFRENTLTHIQWCKYLKEVNKHTLVQLPEGAQTAIDPGHATETQTGRSDCRSYRHTS